MDGSDLARIVAVKLGGRHYDLHAPVLVERAEVRAVFLGEPAVRSAIQRARSAQVAVTGIGSVDERDSSFLRAELLTRVDLAVLRNRGAVGEMVGRFFDRHGRADALEINQRVIGIELEDLHAIPTVVAVARGLNKAAAILGALNGRYLNVLVTDDVTARAVFALAGEGYSRTTA